MDSSAHQATLKALQARDENKVCVDCATKNPQWATVNFGTFMCLDCSGQHRGLGTHISFVRSVGMDKWKDLEVERMKAGGNDAFRAYARENGIDQMDIKQKYNTKAAAVYAAKLKSKATGEPYVEPPDPAAAMRTSQNNSVPYVSSAASNTAASRPSGPAKSSAEDWGWGSSGIGGFGSTSMGSSAVASARGSNGMNSGMNASARGPAVIPASRAGGFSSADYQRMQGGGGGDGGASGFGGGAMGTPQGSGYRGSARNPDSGYGVDFLQESLGSLRQQYESGQLQDTAAKTAAQAASQLSSWFSSASTFVSQQVTAYDGSQAQRTSSGMGANELRSAIQQNLGATHTDSGSRFSGFGSNSMPPSASGNERMGGYGSANASGMGHMGSTQTDPTQASLGGGYQQSAGSVSNGAGAADGWDNWGFGPSKPTDAGGVAQPQGRADGAAWGWPDDLAPAKKE
ncbi:putative ADP-ribosylation factor GTPase-activating protein AGD6 [Porphyridium purpureum]|uniref:Putative ADP-ribosylation factor GTPase-activating protein AGD6 n=1 Tax=Porphyridium purpureum TaxID=35688 RepID=A0A5J4YQT1_PORPP|nr:putative ADP-ribosylation factor GTPase-activating protein AGD6 [Porphyridium purpureum]|eukprot:POR9089..scf236_6